MIDLLKIEIENFDLINHFRNSDKLYMYSDSEVLSKYDNETINIKSTKQYKGIYFSFERDRLRILFKPHYYFNDNLHNANDFSVNSCIKVLSEFVNIFNLKESDLQMMRVVNIEYGLNVQSPIRGTDLIDFLYLHNKEPFKYKNELQYYKEQSKSLEKIIKAYSKGVQFPEYCNIDTFRFEVKSKKSRHINGLEIFNFLDLLNFDVYQNMRDKILIEFSQVLILHQSVNMKLLDDKEQLKLKDYLNTYYWNEILKSKHRHTFRNHKTKYNELLSKTGFNIHKELEQIFLNKLDELSSRENKICTLSHLQDKKENYTHSHIYKGWNCTIGIKKICSVTGLSLEYEEQGAKYIKTSSLKYLKENNRPVYEMLRYNLLHNSRQRPKFENNEIMHLAKQIRNKYYNPKKELVNRIKIEPSQLNMFW